MSVAACAALLERGDPDRFLAVMSLPVPAREVLFPIYAFNLEVARAPWVTEEPMIAEMRLQWWRDAVEEIGAGQPPRAHEVTGPLAGAMARQAGAIAAVFDRAIAARRWDIYKDPFEDAAHFERYLDETAGGLTWGAALALGAPEALEGAVRDVAWAGGVAGWLRAIPELEARGRRPLVDGRPEAVAALAGAALERLASGQRADFGVAAPALRAHWLALPVLRQAARSPGLVAAGGLGVSEFRRRLSLLWQSVRSG